MIKPAAEPDDAQEAILAQMLTELTEAQRLGQQPNLESLAGRHPDLADELRQLWAVVQIADAAARPGDISSRAKTEKGPAAQVPALPRHFGNYELLEELGRGGMGVVYKARQVSPERLVALKMVLGGDLASAADLARFRAEPQSTAQLDHPHIVPVYEVGSCAGQDYFSMKYVEGTTLARLLAGGPLPARETAECLATICDAVHYAHEHGILHRDLKPSNVLLDEQGRPFVTDFGLAKPVTGGNSLTPTGASVGTPAYMSPEQASPSRGSLSQASDVYSLGAILYEMLTGQPPVRGSSYFETILLVLNSEIEPPHVRNPKVNRELELICLKCLEKQPALRYPTSAALADDLRRFLRDEPTTARPISLHYFVIRMMSDTHHASVLENWGTLWMWHSVKIFLLCLITNAMVWRGITSHLPYLLFWSISLIAWGAIFWAWRRRGGPVLAIERQFAHVWAAGVAGCISMFVIEWLLERPVLSLTPGLAAIGGMVFLAKAGMLSGSFYISAAVLFLSIIPIALFPSIGPLLFGLVSAACFFVPGFKYYRRRRAALSELH